MDTNSKKLIQRAQKIWNEKYQIELTEEQARQVLDSGVRFFTILQDWDSKSGSSSLTASDDKQGPVS
jgi:hypothetical protein